MKKSQLIARTYRIKKEQDKAIKAKSKKSKGALSESEIVRRGIDSQLLTLK